MSTNALIVVPDGDSWSGTYCHWDGMSLHAELFAIVKRDGLVTALQTLFTHEWSSLLATMPSQEEIDAAKPDQNANYASAARHRYLQDEGMESPERVVPGYGIYLYNSDEWEISRPERYTGYPEFLHKIMPDGILCYDFDDEINPKLIRSILFEDVDPDLSQLKRVE